MKFFPVHTDDSRFHEHVTILLLYLSVTILLTWPLVLHMDSVSSGDGYIYVHAFWWFKKALLSLKNPLFTDYVFYPQGVNLVFNSGVFSSFLMTLPVHLLWGIPEAINVSHILSFTLSGYFTFLLAYELTASRLAAFIAGLLYGFNPYHFNHFPAQLNLSELQWIPFYLLLLKRTVERERLLWPILGGICAVIVMLTDSIQLIIIVLLSLMVLFWQLVPRRTDVDGRTRLLAISRRVAVLTGTFVLAGSGYLWQAICFLRDSRSTLVIDLFDKVGANQFSADVASFIMPWRKDAVYLGCIMVLLGLWGGWRNRRTTWGRILLTMVCAGIILSLGPTLHVNGQWKGADGSYRVLPFTALAKLPLFAEVRTPYRFHIITMLGAALLAGLGFGAVQQKLARAGTLHSLFVGCVLLILLEYYPGPKLYENPAAVPFIYHDMGKDTDAYTVLQLPLSRWSAIIRKGTGGPYLLQYYQLVHGKRIFGGLVTRTSAESLKLPDFVLDNITDLNEYERFQIFEQNRTPSPQEIEEVRSLAKTLRSGYSSFTEKYQTKYIVFHSFTARPDSLSRVFMEEFLQKKVVNDSRDGTAYIKMTD